MRSNSIKNIRSLSTVLLAEEAMKRNIKVEHINNYQEGMAFLELSYKKHFEYIIGQSSSQTSDSACYAVKNKSLTKSLLIKAGVNVAKGKLFRKNNINEVDKFIDKIKYPIVIKPFDGAHGDLVFIGIKTKNDFDKKIKKIFQKHKYVLVEKEFSGKEYRFIATANKIIAVTFRDPANIIGDGIHNIKDLIKIKNMDLLRGEDCSSPLVKIKIDKILKKYLTDQKLNINCILAKDVKVYLRKESNISKGGDSIDFTDQVHPAFKKIVISAVEAIPGLAYGGVDLMTNKDISKKPTKNSYVIVEINSSPGIDIHHFPYKGKPRNVAKEIIDILFPETKGKYIEK